MNIMKYGVPFDPRGPRPRPGPIGDFEKKPVKCVPIILDDDVIEKLRNLARIIGVSESDMVKRLVDRCISDIGEV